jgi:hypothetical protein
MAAKSLDQLDIPTAEIGKEIPVLFGTKKVTSPNVVWYGDLRVYEKEKEDQTVGYNYYLGMHLALCHDMQRLLAIEVDGRALWGDPYGDGIGTDTSAHVWRSSFFGGFYAGGGIGGTFRFHDGNPNQMPNAYLASKLPTTWSGGIPAFRGVASLVLEHVWVGDSDMIRPWHAWGRNIYYRSGLNNPVITLPNGIQAMNPANLLAEIILNEKWGLGYTLDDIDVASFNSANSVLASENFGMCALWTQEAEIGEFIKDLLNHIDAFLFSDIHTGKLRLKLIRDDFDIDNLPVFDEDNIIEVKSFKRNTYEESPNTLTIKFWDSDTGEKSSLTRSDIALVAQAGRTISKTLEYPLVAHKDTAEKLLSRDLQSLSTNLATATLETNLDGMRVSIGDPILMSWPRYGIDQIVLRVVSIKYGDLSDSKLRLECIEDVFSNSSAVYSQTGQAIFQPPSQDAAPCSVHILEDMPKFIIGSRLGTPVSDSVTPTQSYVMCAGVPSTQDTISIDPVFKNPQGSYSDSVYASQSFRCKLNFDVYKSTSNMDITWLNQPNSIVPDTYALIGGSEIVLLKSVLSSSIVVERGLFDTVPKNHPKDTVVILFGKNGLGVYNRAFSVGSTAYLKIGTIAIADTLEPEDAPEQTLVTSARHYKPLRPANLRVAGMLDDLAGFFSWPINVTWSHRNRLTEIERPLTWDEDSTDLEAGVVYNYTLQAYDANDTLLGTVDSGTTTGTSYEVTEALVSGYTTAGYFKFTIEADRSGVKNLQTPSILFYRPINPAGNVTISYTE